MKMSLRRGAKGGRMGKRAAKRKVALAVILAASALVSFGAMDGVVLKCETDRAPCSYSVGEKMAFSFSLLNLEAGEPLDGLRLKWKRSGDDGMTQEGLMPLSGGVMRVETSLAKPGFVRMAAWVVDSSGANVKRARTIGRSCIGNDEISGSGR